jgi:2-keto-3-deoxy-L-rhamnonate aldolase RhmA
MPDRPHPSKFRQRFLAGENLLGTFIKTPTSHTSELIGSLGFDFVVIDEEHGPFDRGSIDQALLGAKASGTAGIVRVSEPSAAKLLAVLDDGATGILAPHVASAAKAREIVACCRYRGGKRGYSNTNRGGGFGATGVWEHVDQCDAETVVIAMIEDPEALDVLDEIMAVEGLDGVFIGRGDLTVALGANGYADPRVQGATEKIITAARAFNKRVCIMVANAAEAAQWQAYGVSAFIVSSDQGFLRSAALKTRGEFDALSAKILAKTA